MYSNVKRIIDFAKKGENILETLSAIMISMLLIRNVYLAPEVINEV